MLLIDLIPRARCLRLLHLGWIMATLGSAPAWASQQAAVARAQLVQETLPDLTARKQRATEQHRAAQALFNGTGTLEAAFPALSTAPLFSTGFIRGEHAALETRAEQRATDRVSPPPAHLLPAQIRQWRAALQDTLDAEEQSDVARRRILDAIAAGLKRAPDLGESATLEMEARWKQLRAPSTAPTPDEQRLAQAAGQAASQLHRLRAAALRQMLVPGDPTLTDLLQIDASAAAPVEEAWSRTSTLLVEARLERLSRSAPLADQPERLTAPIERLRRMLIEQSLPGLRRAIEEQKRQQQEAEESIALEPIDELETAARAARTHLEAVRAEADTAGFDPNQPDSGPIDERHRLQIALAELRLATMQTRIDRRSHLAHSGLSLDTRATAADIAKARAIAADAKEKADAAVEGDRRAAELQQLIAQLRARIAADLTAEGARHDAAVGRYEVLLRAVEEHGQDISVATALSPLSVDRAERIDATYRSLSSTIGQIRTERQALSQALRTATDTQDAEDETTEAAPESEALASALADLRNTQASTLQTIEDELDAVLILLARAKDLRQRVRSRTSMQQRQSADLVSEVSQEINELPAILLSQIRHHRDQVRALPLRLTQLTTWGEWLFIGLKLALLLLLWTLVQRQSASWTAIGLAAIDPAGHRKDRPWEHAQWYPGWMVSGDLLAMEAPLARVFRSLADLLVAGSLLAFLTPRSAFLGIAAYIGVGVSLVRLLPDLVRLGLITPAHRRPALRVVAAPARQLVLWTVRIAVIWFVFEAGLVYVAEQVMDADHLALLVKRVGSVVLVFIALVALHRWSPHIRNQLRDDEGALQRWAARDSRSTIGRTTRATVGALFLCAQWFIHLIGRIIDRRAGLSWIGAALARRQLKEDEGKSAPAIDETLRSAIAQIAPERIENAAAAHRIQSFFETWQQERRQGMLALIGDRGMGKSRLIHRLRPLLSANMEVVDLALNQRLTEPRQALEWLAKQVGIEDLVLPPETEKGASWAEQTAEALRKRPPTVFIFQHTDRLFLRSVGRFQAMQAVLAAMQACSGHHFWMCTFHGPAWTFLDGIGAVVNLSGFHERVILEPLAPNEISDWLESATRSAGAQPQYSRLVQRRGTGKEQARLLERASRAYWRLLTDTSQGNPRVALSLWLKGLRQTPDPGIVDIGLFKPPDSMDLDDLSDTDLFALTALIIHNGATLEELEESLNLPAGEVRSTCRNLESRTIIDLGDDSTLLFVTDLWLPAVERLLRRRSFLHRR